MSDNLFADLIAVRRGLTAGAACCVLAASLWLSGAPSASAEPAGIVIARDGSNVNVTLDPTVIPDVSIKRNGDRMVIHIPKGSRSAGSRLIIDSALRKGDLVEEADTPSGKTITVNSQQVYLITEDLSQSKLEDLIPQPPKPAPAKPQTKPEPKPVEIAVNPPAPVPATKTEPAAQAAKPPAATASPANASSPAPAAVASPAKTVSQAATETAASPDLTPKPEPAAETPNAPTDATETVGAPVADHELLPIDFAETQRSSALQNSSALMLRMLASLIAVLALMIAFLKLALPRLMARYPAFFENLQKHGQARQQQEVMRRNLWDASVKSEPKPKREPWSGFFSAKPAASSGKKQYLERIGTGDDTFNVITSTHLGKGKELHLVEIRGRQLVVATTPHTVTLIKDLTEPGSDTDPAPPEDESPLGGLLGSGQEDTEATPEEIREWEDRTDHFYNPDFTPSTAQAPQRTRAYLEDDPPVIPPEPPRRETRNKRFASKTPLVGPSGQEGNPLDRIYLKYLDNRPGDELERAEHQRQNVKQSGIDNFMQPQGHPTVDAEEVVVLEDYDDHYNI